MQSSFSCRFSAVFPTLRVEWNREGFSTVPAVFCSMESIWRWHLYAGEVDRTFLLEDLSFWNELRIQVQDHLIILSCFLTLQPLSRNWNRSIVERWFLIPVKFLYLHNYILKTNNPLYFNLTSPHTTNVVQRTKLSECENIDGFSFTLSHFFNQNLTVFVKNLHRTLASIWSENLALRSCGVLAICPSRLSINRRQSKLLFISYSFDFFRTFSRTSDCPLGSVIVRMFPRKNLNNFLLPSLVPATSSETHFTGNDYSIQVSTPFNSASWYFVQA